MNDTLTLALTVSGMALLFIVFIGVFICVCSRHSKIYKSFKKPVKTMGVIDDIRLASVPHDDEQRYIITYSYTDGGGMRHSATLKWLQNAGRTSDKITVHYDSRAPENSIADLQLKYGKSLRWKIPLILAVLTVPTVFTAVYFD